MRTFKALVILFSVLTFSAVISLASQIPSVFIESVVALGSFQQIVGQPPQWKTEASGFLYGVPIDKETDPLKHQYRIYLVTNRHVLENHTAITIRFNPEQQTDPARTFGVALKDEHGVELWTSHPNTSVDVSVMPINGAYLREQHLQSSFFASDQFVADTAKMKEIGVSIGDDVFVLGFPMGISDKIDRNYVIARRGSIAKIDDVARGTFLIDALVFPGNSGGPVVLATNVNFLQGTKPQERAYLIGMVRSYLPYRDVAFSGQTGEARLLSEENSGLAEVIPVDYLNETIKAAQDAEQKRVVPPVH